ncbi:MAG: N-acetylglucosamine-6-phosphate deacetylase [Anaerolineae bacterium]|jgi:N-acetylglucosamine-6-phosphate deacetylase|nr:N-acetylglucosamine-6-phosphate deacetylase [Chloroflexota bacterium]
MGAQGATLLEIPGLVDLQVNGYLGVDFSSPDLTEQQLVDAWRGMLAAGTAAFLPTLITSAPETYARNLPLIAHAMRRDEFQGHVLGIHLEGPFISREPGAVGAHNPDCVLSPDVEYLTELLDAGENAVRMLTIAAEVPGAERLARLARQRGVTVSVGHSLFSSEDLDRLYGAGAQALTHLGNGLPNMLPRHPNPVWAGLADRRLVAMIIADGHHLPLSVLQVMTRARSAAGNLVLVSDAAPVAGLPPGEYLVLGNRAVLEPSGRLHNPEKGHLVGSSATLVQCANVLLDHGILSLEATLFAACHAPLALLGLDEAVVKAIPGRALYLEDGRLVVCNQGT